MKVFTMSGDICSLCLDTSQSGAEGNRTPDLLVANEARYQLRYSPSHRPDREGQISTLYAGAKNYSFEARLWRKRATASSANC